MSKVEFSAGRFKVTCWTNGYPLRAELEDGDRTMRIEGREIKDVEHILGRVRTAMRAHYLRPGYSMENYASELE